MILVQQEAALPVHVQHVKKEVLLCLQAVHMLHEYATVGQLTQFLDANLQEAGLAGLTRVVLFYADPTAVIEVERRMANPSKLQQLLTFFKPVPDQGLLLFQQPGCWLQLEPQLPDLRARADRYEPGWVAREMAKE